jgi:raffinose/stachyose/melibiose transport system permease protein
MQRLFGISPFRVLLFLAPAAGLYVVFVVVPVAASVALSLHRWDGLAASLEFVGLGNYADLASDPLFVASVARSLLWTLATGTLPVFIGLILAALLAEDVRGRMVFRTVFYLPVVLSAVAVGVVWSWMYNPVFGVVNGLLGAVGIGPIGFLGEARWAMPAMVLADTWSYFGFPMVIFLAAIQSIDRDLYEAAMVDGATSTAQFVYITLPLLRRATTLAVTIAVIRALKVFALIWAMTEGGPYRSTETIPIQMYVRAFQESQVGYGSAMAVVFTALIMALSVSFWYVRERAMEAAE